MKLLRLSILLVLIASVPILSSSSENQETKFPKQESKAGNQQKSESEEHRNPRDTNSSPATISPDIISPKESPPTANKEKNSKNTNPRNWLDWYAALGPSTWSQWALTVLATGAAIAAWCTFGIMRKQLEISDDALKISERAWITVKFDIPYKLGDRYVAFRVINTGKTPGHIKQSRVLYFDPSDMHAPISWVPDPIPEDKMDTCWSIAPGESLKQRWRVDIPEIEIKGIANETKRLTLYGFILYDDIFGKRHRTAFYRIFSADTAPDIGVFIIPPETEARPGQNEAT